MQFFCHNTLKLVWIIYFELDFIKFWDHQLYVFETSKSPAGFMFPKHIKYIVAISN